jgi:phage terminase large subunit GpA-like protein
MDEISRFPVSSGTEGDPVFLVRQRTTNFWNRKIIMASTPTNEGSCRITQAFEQSDKRYYYLPCPHCGEFHTLKWSQMIWEGSDPSTAKMACPVCGSLYSDSDKLRMLPKGEWRATSESNGIAGFHISALYSPWQSFTEVVNEWYLKKDNPQTLKTFINLQLGEPFEDRTGESVKADVLMRRREMWDAVPEDVAILTCGVDTQDDRLEASLWGFTGSEQGRVIGHYQFHGSPGEPKVWRELDEFLRASYETQDGRFLRIRAAAIDSGGHHTQNVYDFCRDRAHRSIYAIKGRNGAHPIWPVRGLTTKLSQGVKVFVVGVDTAKDLIRSALAVTKPNSPRYIAFSADLPDEYFRQLTVERRQTKTNQSGHAVRKWVKPSGARNEAFDCAVYAHCALESLKASGIKLKRLALRSKLLDNTVEPQPEIDESIVVEKPKKKPLKSRRSSLLM